MANIPPASPLDVREAPRLEGEKKPEGRGSSKLGKDEFLKLLMAQLGNQDPTAPTDSGAFVAQLAQFTSLELQQNANSHLEQLLMGQASAQQTSVVSLVGKEILYRTDALALRDGQPATAVAALAAPAANVAAVVQDGNGKVVRSMQLGAHEAGALPVSWDGRDDAGVVQKPGTYTLRVTASDQAGKNVAVDQRGRAVVSGVSFDQGYAELLLGDTRIQLSDVVEIKERSTP
jgi:flagellar basal-body rod modification protein FlgD